MSRRRSPAITTSSVRLRQPRSVAALVAVALSCAACGTSLSHTVSDAQIEPLTAEQRKPVAEYAGEARDAAGDLLDAEKDTRAAKRALHKIAPPPPEPPAAPAPIAAEPAAVAKPAAAEPAATPTAAE